MSTIKNDRLIREQVEKRLKKNTYVRVYNEEKKTAKIKARARRTRKEGDGTRDGPRVRRKRERKKEKTKKKKNARTTKLVTYLTITCNRTTAK